MSNNHNLMRLGKTCDVKFAKDAMWGMNAPIYDNVTRNIANGVELL